MERDTKRQLQKQQQQKLNLSEQSQMVPKGIKTPAVTMAKSITKPLSYEDLMQKAEENSKNTLSKQDFNLPPTIRVMSDYPKKEASFQRSIRSNSNAKPSKHVSRPVKIVKKNFQPHPDVNLITLNQKKRDLRSIEQIQHELKEEKVSENRSNSPKRKEKEEIVSSDSDGEMEKIKKTKCSPEEFYSKNYSSIISKMFGYDRKKSTEWGGNDDLSDMEADYETIRAEEARSVRLGIKEDLDEERREHNRKMTKLKHKQQKSQRL